MKIFTLTFVLCIASGAALAESRPATINMSCTAAASLVRTQGAVVLSTGRDTFDRFVRDASFCAYGQVLLPGFAPTSNLAQCQVGWRCWDETLPSK